MNCFGCRGCDPEVHVAAPRVTWPLGLASILFVAGMLLASSLGWPDWAALGLSFALLALSLPLARRINNLNTRSIEVHHV